MPVAVQPRRRRFATAEANLALAASVNPSYFVVPRAEPVVNESTFGYQAELPEENREMFTRLCNDLAWLSAKWRLYLDLFSEKENADLLSSRAPGAFQIIEESLRNDMTMAMSRLSDPSQTGRRQNLSLARVAERFDHVPGLRELREEFNRACKPIQTLRNKLVGHRDLDTVLNPHDNPLPGIGRDEIDNILRLAGTILNVLVRSVADTEYRFELRVIGDGEALLESLRIAERVYRAERDRLESLCRG